MEVTCLRHRNNPVITPDPSLDEDGIYNPAVFALNGTIFLLPRVRRRSTHESCFTLAWSDDGSSYRRLSYPVMSAAADYERPDLSRPRETGGVEDCRATIIGDRIYLVYTGYSRRCHLCLAWIGTGDFLDLWARSRNTGTDLSDTWNRAWKRLGPVFPEMLESDRDFTRNGCIFTRGGRFYLLFRENYEDIQMAVSDNPEGPWHTRLPLLAREHAWEKNRIGISSPPVPVAKDKLLFLYHGVADGPPVPGLDHERTYHLGAFLAKFESGNGHRVKVARLEHPVLSPREDYEIFAGPWLYNPEVKVAAVFSCGMIRRGPELIVPYSAGDQHICLATLELEPLVEAIESPNNL